MIKSVKLSDFRNFKRKSFDFSDKITVIVGPNASGKTNILESLFLLSTGKSLKAQLEVEMIRYECSLARVDGVLLLGSPKAFPPANKLGAPSLGPPASHHPSKLEVITTRGDNGWPKKGFWLMAFPSV